MTNANQAETTMPRAGVPRVGDQGPVRGTQVISTDANGCEERIRTPAWIRQAVAEGETVLLGAAPAVLPVPVSRANGGGDRG